MVAEFNPAGMIKPDELSLKDVRSLITTFNKKSLDEVFAVLGEEGELTLEAIDVLAQLIVIGQRKVNPEFTVDDALEQPISVFSKVMEGLSEEDPPQLKEESQDAQET